MIHSRILKGFKELDSIKDIWEELVKTQNCDISVSYTWSKILWESHLPEKDVTIILVQEDDSVLGIFPVCCKKKTINLIPIKEIYVLSNLYCIHNELIVRNVNKKILTVFFDTLDTIPEFKGWNTFGIEAVVSDSPTDQLIKSYLSSCTSYFFSEGVATPFIKTNDLTWDEYIKTRSKNTRKNFKRKINIIKNAGQTEVKVLNNFDEICSVLKKIEIKCWKYEAGSAIFNIKHQEDFYKSLIKQFASELKFFVLYLNKKPISYCMCIFQENKIWSLKTSYDEVYKQYSPGIILKLWLLEYCFNNHYDEFDFGGENDPHKLTYTDKIYNHKNYYIFNSDIYSQIAYKIFMLRHGKRRFNQ